MQLEEENQSPKTIEKDIKAMLVKRDGDPVGQSFFGKWRWTPTGREAFTEEQRLQASERRLCLSLSIFTHTTPPPSINL